MTSIGKFDPVSLDEAAELCLRGMVKSATLKAAARRGELTVYRVGRRVLTTVADVEEWFKKCQSKGEARTYTSSVARTALRSGIYGTAEAGLAQDATRAMLTALAKR